MSIFSVPSATGASSATNSTSTSGSGSASSFSQSDFLQLLTAQLQYQNPDSPSDPSQMASEFAQISTVTGITNLNTQLTDFEASAAAGQMAGASDLIGKQVAVSGDTLTPNSAGTADGAFSLQSAAQNVTVNVFSPSGAEAGTINLGAMSAGQQSFSWDNGTAGTQYTYQVDATGASGASVSATPYTVYTVNGVNVSGSTPTLNVEGSSTAIDLSEVATVLGASS